MTPKYTFLLPAYKARYFKQALESIQAQTYKDFHVIISDDCSPEDIYSIAKPFLKDPRFTYRRNEKNIGAENLVSHWNLLLSLAGSEFVAMATDDDVYEPTFLETLDALTAKYPDVNVFHSPTQYINADGVPTSPDYCYKEYMPPLEFWYCFTHTFRAGISQFIFRRQQLSDRGGFVELPLAWGSDCATVLLMADNGMASSLETLCSFRRSDINISCKTSARLLLTKVRARLEYNRWVDARVKTLTIPDDRYKTMYQLNVLDHMHIYYKERLVAQLKECHGMTYLRAFRLIKRDGMLSSRDLLSMIKLTIFG